ncbi:MAG TPA: hypothetical protein VN899_01840 [Stellaceae bacterium]|nr:hypothetical protein [Stellaceae bacterium]
MSHSVEIIFAADHPAAQGHFPGNPIIPGAVLLDEVLGAIGASAGSGVDAFEILSVKFLRPVRPGARVTLRWENGASGQIKFQCHLAPDQPAATGTLRLGALPR